MPNKLTKIYQSDVNKKFKNNKSVYYSNGSKEEPVKIREDRSVEEEIKSLFEEVGYAFNIPLIIKTKEDTYETSIIAKRNNTVITFDNKVIPISEIVQITRKNRQ